MRFIGVSFLDGRGSGATTQRIGSTTLTTTFSKAMATAKEADRSGQARLDLDVEFGKGSLILLGKQLVVNVFFVDLRRER